MYVRGQVVVLQLHPSHPIGTAATSRMVLGKKKSKNTGAGAMSDFGMTDFDNPMNDSSDEDEEGTTAQKTAADKPIEVSLTELPQKFSSLL